MEAIRTRWMDLLNARRFRFRPVGKVVVLFKLHTDGTITDLRTQETNMNEGLTLVCSKAILDRAPYKRWPKEMHSMIGRDYREITFTFYYTDDLQAMDSTSAADKK